MPLFIGKTKIQPPFTLEIALKALYDLPLPQILSRGDQTVKPEEALFVFQSETAHINRATPGSNIKYVGTKSLSECIFLQIKNEIDIFIAHIDNKSINLIEALANFSSHQDLSVTLVGGKQGCQASYDNICHIIQSLHEAAIYYNTDITITHQLVIKNNVFEHTQATESEFLYDRMLRKADYLSQYLFRCPLNKEIFIKETAEHLLTKDVQETSALNAFLGLLYISHPCLTFEQDKLPHLINAVFPQEPTKERFEQMLKNAISIQGMKIFSSSYTIHKLFPVIKMTNFIMELNGNKIISISPTFPVTQELYRNALFYALKYKAYIHIYDTDTRQLILPLLSRNCVSDFREARNQVSSRISTADKLAEIAKTLGIDYRNNIFLRDEIFNVIVNEGYELKKSTKASSAFFSLHFSKREFKDFYQENAVTQTSTLSILEELTGLSMLGHQRISIEDLLDATCECASIKEAEKIQKNIKTTLGINPYILKFTDKKIVVCIPGINLTACAKKIYDLKENKPQQTLSEHSTLTL